MIILFLLAQVWSAYLDSSLQFIGMTQKDIAFRNDYTVKDPFRFAIIDSLLISPLASIDFVNSLNDSCWSQSMGEFLKTLIKLYGFSNTGSLKQMGFTEGLSFCNRLLDSAFAHIPEGLDSVFEELTIFSPEPTGSIEEEKQAEKEYDSLVCYLKENGTGIDYNLVFQAGAILENLIREFQLRGFSLRHRSVSGIEGGVLYYNKFDFGEVVIGDSGANIYNRDFAVIIEPDGDDTYKFSATQGRIHIIIDYQGDDRYEGRDYTAGGAKFGVSFLVDEAGDDTYIGRNFSLGSGVFGLGILIDKKGNDHYYGDTFIQGAGGFGIGILKDCEGNDVYEGCLYAQGFASTYGIGVLADKSGNDIYIIKERYLDEIRYLDHYLSLSQGFSIGFRPELSAGLGFIFDQAGNDYYLGDIFAQGSSYWYGLGAIVDGKGNDNYVAYQYAQGAGTHITIGLLIDKSGNDNYVSKGVSQGCGHDLSLGLLYDIAGDDTYCAFDLSQGAGNANGVGILMDELGNDTYAIKRTSNTQGYGNFRREYGSIGVLLDIRGRDFYCSGENSSLWQKGKYGVGVDWE